MRILVTGASGFLGSHVADALSERGHDVVLYDRVASPYRREDQTMVVGTILDPAQLEAAMAGCGAVYHFAAIAAINEAMAEPRRTVEVNIMGTLNVLDAARAARAGRFVFGSSMYVYSSAGSFYRTSKQAGELLVQDYRDQFGLAYTILRFGSLYGPRAGMSNAVHRMLTQALAERRIDYGGTGQEIREYIHVLDAAQMSADALDPRYEGLILHLMGSERMRTGEMLSMIDEMLGGGIDLRLASGDMKGHYVQTPFSYTPRLGRKMTRELYIDLGLGLLDCAQAIDQARNGED